MSRNFLTVLAGIHKVNQEHGLQYVGQDKRKRKLEEDLAALINLW